MTRTSHLKVVTQITLLIATFVALLAFVLYQTVSEANAIAADQSRSIVHAAVDGEIRQMQIIAEDNALWDDAAEAVYRDGVSSFFWTSWGAPTAEGKIYDLAAVLDHDGNTLVAFVDGKAVNRSMLASFGPSLQLLIDQASRKRKAMGGLVRDDRAVYTVAVSDILPISRDLESIIPANGPHRIIFAKRFSTESLGNAAENPVLPEVTLRLAIPTAEDGSLSSPLSDALGQPLAYLTWTPDTPGFNGLKRAMPFILLGALLHLGIVIIVIRRSYVAYHRLTEQAMVDSLSQLPNRRALRQALTRHLEKGEHAALAMMDLDGFKGVNDNFGHQVGDRLIKEVANALCLIIGNHGMVARLGGDEFAVVITGDGCDEKITSFAQRILGRFAQPFRIDERTTGVGVSIGLSLSTEAGIEDKASTEAGGSASELMRRADVAMYAAKRAGKMRVSWYDEEIDQKQVKAHGIESDLRTALERDEFTLVYQPQIATDSRRLCAVETLLRWTHPQRGEVAPSEFIPVAEETGLIDRIGQWVLRKACTDGLEWDGVRVTVNVSPAQLRNPEFSKKLSEILEDTGFPPHRLELEVTERFLVFDADLASKAVESIRHLGVAVVLDEYGSGFASLGFLGRFGFSKIKIDQALVRESVHSEKARSILQASVAVGRALDITVAATGVETAAQMDLMRVAGCDELQGWHFSQAIIAEDVAALVKAWNRPARTRPPRALPLVSS